MAKDALTDLPGKIESSAFFLKLVDNSQALLAVPESSSVQIGKLVLANVSERGVTQIVSQRYRLCEVLVEVQRPGGGARYLRDLQSVGESGLRSGRRAEAMKTCVLCFSRRNALVCSMRSRSLWNSERMGEDCSGVARPRLLSAR